MKIIQIHDVLLRRGPNHLSALNLNFNVCNAEKDDSRAHPSIFVTNSTMTSVAQSDFVNKLLVCSNDGKVILARSNDTKFWSQKQKKKLINFSFAVGFALALSEVSFALAFCIYVRLFVCLFLVIKANLQIQRGQ